MKTRRIDEFGDEYYYCERCGESVYEYDDYCDVCGNNLATINEFPRFRNNEQGETYYKNKYKIMDITDNPDSKFGVVLLVKANPIKTQSGLSGFIHFTEYICEETVLFMYPLSQKNISMLTAIAENSLLDINFDDFQPENVYYNRQQMIAYRHKSFFDYSRPEFYNGIINLSSISKTDKESEYKIILPNGDCYFGEIKDNMISGWGRYYFSNGKDIPKSELDSKNRSQHHGYFKNGLPNGIGVFNTEWPAYPERPRVEEWGYFLNGKKNGVCLCRREGISEVGLYRSDRKIKDFSAEMVERVGVETVDTFWYRKLGIWIGVIYSDYTNDYNGLLILNDGDCYMGTMLGGFNRTKIRGIKILSNGTTESGEWNLDIKGMTPTEYACGM